MALSMRSAACNRHSAARNHCKIQCVGFLCWFWIGFVALFLAAQAHAEWHSDTQGIMGTEVTVTLWHEEPTAAKHAIEQVMAEMRRVDQSLSPYIESSELSVVNRRAYEKTQQLSDELANLIDKSLYFSRISEGAFDITFASLARHYDYRSGKKPDNAAFNESLPAINYKWLEFDKSKKQLRFLHEKVAIDLGGVAKGYAVDRAVAILRGLAIEHASVSAGGDSRLLGDKRGRPWVVGIKHPRQPDGENEAAIRLPLSDLAMSTSGDYERYFIDSESGERIHHIIKPSTGKSASEVMSVTILGDEGINTDPLSTTVFVLGVEKGLALVNALPGFDAIIIDAKGKVHYSNGLAAGGS